MSTKRSRFWFALGLAILANAVAPATVKAHPRLTRSDPSAGQRLAVAPGALRLWFSERPELTLTSLTLLDSAGRSVVLRAIERDEGDKLGVLARIPERLRPGRYAVNWRTAAADGHPTTGSFTFTVLSAAVTDTSSKAISEQARATPPDSMVLHRETESPSGLMYVAVRAVTFACLLVIIGAVVFRFAILQRVLTNGDLRMRVSNRVATVAGGAAMILLLAAAARLALQMDVLNAGSDAQPVTMRDLVAGTRWGSGWLLQVLSALVAAVAFGAARRAKAGWLVAAGAALVLSITPALGGHAAASPRLSTLAIVADAAHVLGASGWLGSLLVLTAVAIPSVASADGEGRWSQIASLVNAFSPTALAFAALLALTGVFAAWLHIGSVSALWDSGYGRTLILKLLALVPLAATGAYNWRLVRPTLGTTAATKRLRRSASAELAVGVIVLGITAVLVATEPPIR